MNTQELRERATLALAEDGRPTAKFLGALRDLNTALQDRWTSCELCDSNRAAVIHTGERSVHVTCRSCSYRLRKASPLDRRRMWTAAKRRA